MSDYLQFDTSDIVVGGVNLTEAIKCDVKLVFNESYTVTGEILRAPSLYACYDLTVIGNVEVDEIDVSGNLYVFGDIKAKRISCLKSIVCTGKIDSKEIFGSEVIANDIVCNTISCQGNIIAKSTIDINELLKCEKSVMAGEGILGNGHFDTNNAVAVEYFDFSGEVLGKVIELETDTVVSEQDITVNSDEPLSVLVSKLDEKIKEELLQAGDIDEDKLVEFVEQVSAIDNNILSDWKYITEKVIELSYSNNIENLLDYLIIVMAKKILPKEITEYETVEHVFTQLFVDAEKKLNILPFHANSIEDFTYALKIVMLCENEINIDKNEVLDKIFQSIGIKYKTVESFLK